MNIAALAVTPVLRTARARIRELDAEVLEEQLRLVAIPAPTFEEGERAAYVAERFRAVGLVDVHLDEVGNVLGRLATAPASRKGAALVTAHLDTVFAREAVLEPRRVGRRIYAPGITDNCRGLAALLGTARVMAELELRPVRPLWFIATVGEEGAGDLYGVKHLLRSGSVFAGAATFVSIDGSGLRRIVHRALGSRRIRVEIRGPGGHSWSDFGTANPVHAAGAAIHALSQISLPADPPTSLTVARAGGGTTINSIPEVAWFEIDMRSEGSTWLDTLEHSAREAIATAAEQENQRRRPGTGEITTSLQMIGDRPSGIVELTDPLVRATMKATRMLGAEPEMVSSSTDSNVAISLGISAVTIGAGGDSGGIHTPDEWYENQQGAEGLERSLLVTIAAAGGLADGYG